MAANIAADGELPMPTLEVKPIFFTSNIISFAKCSSPPNKWLQPVILRSRDFSFFVEIQGENFLSFFIKLFIKNFSSREFLFVMVHSLWILTASINGISG